MSAHDWRRVPGKGRYARPERERRFLVQGRTPAPELTRDIEDRYLTGTRLRLRTVSAGGEVVHKLTQKVRLRHDDPAEVALTNTYLSAQEHEHLCQLPGAALSKTRHLCRAGRHVLVVDEFHGRLEGLRLVEVEVDDLDEPLELPSWVGREVTHDDRFSGGFLATAGADAIAEVLALATAP